MKAPLHICEDLLGPVRGWAVFRRATFGRNGPGRQFCVLQERPDAPKEVWSIKSLVMSHYMIPASAPTEPMFQDFCGVITDGGAVHRHSDPNVGELIHTRFNVMVSKPDIGGVPIINGVPVQVEEGEVWRCDAGLYEHECTTVTGFKPRVVLSFGFLLPNGFGA